MEKKKTKTEFKINIRDQNYILTFNLLTVIGGNTKNEKVKASK